MDISHIQSSKSIQNPYLLKNRSPISTSLAAQKTGLADTVNISNEARLMFESSQKTQVSKPNQIPLEAYAVPDWLADLTPAELEVDISSLEAFHNSTMGYSNLQNSTKEKLSEYMDTILQYYHDAIRDQGIDVDPEIIRDQETDEALQRDVYQRISEDERTMALMHEFGLSLD